MLGIAAGALRHLITIQEFVRTPDGQGGYTTVPHSLVNGTVWAEITPGSASKQYAQAAIIHGASHVMRTRYFEGYPKDCQILYGTRTFTVRGVVIEDERDRCLVWYCDEQT